MAYQVNYNRDMHTTETPYVLTCEQFLSSDFSVTKRSESEVMLSNMTSPLGCPEVLKRQLRTIQNIYANSGIDRALWAPSTRGISLYGSIGQTWGFADPEDASKPAYLAPASISCVLHLPLNPAITKANVEQLIQRMVASIWADNKDRLAQMLRGAINPKED